VRELVFFSYAAGVAVLPWHFMPVFITKYPQYFKSRNIEWEKLSGQKGLKIKNPVSSSHTGERIYRV